MAFLRLAAILGTNPETHSLWCVSLRNPHRNHCNDPAVISRPGQACQADSVPVTTRQTGTKIGEATGTMGSSCYFLASGAQFNQFALWRDIDVSPVKAPERESFEVFAERAGQILKDRDTYLLAQT